MKRMGYNDLQKEINEINIKNQSFNNYNQDNESNYNQYDSNNQNNDIRAKNTADNGNATYLTEKYIDFNEPELKKPARIAGACVFILTVIFCILSPDEIVIFVCTSLLQMVGIVLPVMFISNKKIKKRRCTTRIEAKVIDVTERRVKDDPIHKRYCPVVEFYYQGKRYIVKRRIESSYPEDIAKVGDVQTFFVNPFNVNEFYVDEKEPPILVLFLVAFVGYAFPLAIFLGGC